MNSHQQADAHRYRRISSALTAIQLEKDELDYLREYAAAMERQLARAVSHLHEQASLPNLTAYDIECLAEDYEDLGQRRPRLFRESTFLIAMALAEQSLLKIAFHIARELKCPKRPETAKGNGIDNAETFLKENNLPSAPHAEEWESLKAFHKVRNDIIHNGGRVTLRNKSGIARVIEKHPGCISTFPEGIALDSRIPPKVSVTASALEGVLGALEQLFEKLSKDVGTRLASNLTSM